MNENLLKLLSLYCNNEIENLKISELYIKLQNLVVELNYNLTCEWGKEIANKKSGNLYLSITILNDKNEIVEVFDEGFLTISTLLVCVDKGLHRCCLLKFDMCTLRIDLLRLLWRPVRIDPSCSRPPRVASPTIMPPQRVRW